MCLLPSLAWWVCARPSQVSKQDHLMPLAFSSPGEDGPRLVLCFFWLSLFPSSAIEWVFPEIWVTKWGKMAQWKGQNWTSLTWHHSSLRKWVHQRKWNELVTLVQLVDQGRKSPRKYSCWCFWLTEGTKFQVSKRVCNFLGGQKCRMTNNPGEMLTLMDKNLPDLPFLSAQLLSGWFWWDSPGAIP